MLTLSVKIREVQGRKVKTLRTKGILPAVLYGHKIKNLNLEMDLKEFEKVYKEAGESSLIKLKIELPSMEAKMKKRMKSSSPIEEQKEKEAKEVLVLIKDVKRDPLTDKFLHIDFHQPELKEEIEVTVPLIFEGESPAVKDLGGTLVKNISEVKVKTLPQNLPKEIKVNIETLKTFGDNIKILDLILSGGVRILEKPEEIVASVAHPEKIEEELEKPIEEKVEEVEKVEKEKKEETPEVK